MKKFLILFLGLFFLVSAAYSQINLIEPADNSIINNTNPVFKWSRVAGIPIYKLNVYDAANKNLVYWSVVRTKEAKMPSGFLFQGNKYIWEVEGYNRVKQQLNLIDRSKVFTFEIQSAITLPDPKNFRQKGKTLIIPVEFNDSKHDVTLVRNLPKWYSDTDELMQMVQDYFKDMSNANMQPQFRNPLMRFTYDIYPEVIPIPQDVKYYAKDAQIQKGRRKGQWKLDVGKYKAEFQGQRRLKRDVRKIVRKKFRDLNKTIKGIKNKVFLGKYQHIVYLVPKAGMGLKTDIGTDDFWSSSVPLGGAYNGGGILINPQKDDEDNNLGIWLEKFAKQLRLLDLSPSAKKPQRDLKHDILGEGRYYTTGMSVISKMKPTLKKKDWIKGKVERTNWRKNGQRKVYEISSRDSDGKLLGLACKIKGKVGWYVVEVFDRNKWDVYLPCYIPPTNQAKAGVLIYYVNVLNERLIKRGYLLPSATTQANRLGQFFLPGGIVDEGQGLKIEVLTLKPVGNHYVATIQVDY